MKHRVVERPQARLDFWSIVEYLAMQNVAVAERFLNSVEQTHHFLAEYPISGSLVEDDDLANIRIYPISGFRSYLVVFRVEHDCVDVLHYVHASRDLQSLLQDV